MGFHSTKKPVTTMLTYPWKCTVLHCNHLVTGGGYWRFLHSEFIYVTVCIYKSSANIYMMRIGSVYHYEMFILMCLYIDVYIFWLTQLNIYAFLAIGAKPQYCIWIACESFEAAYYKLHWHCPLSGLLSALWWTHWLLKISFMAKIFILIL